MARALPSMGAEGESCESGPGSFGVDDGREISKFSAISNIWASMLSVREVGREMVCLSLCWKARRALFLFPERSSEGEERIVLAWTRSFWNFALGSTGLGGSSAVGSFAGGVSSALSAPVSGASSSLAVFWRSLRVDRRCDASLGAPVA